ncbi:hypothetical protein GCM10023258_03040 [Terrabacter aeriphilus]|uniref:Lipid/polyisoprenoid-binding YceI-like domain-containing protein n=1 Tax=Terrabacter aeriphilus TaxID=515662 RepID=A0ABP9J360_9MICO
MSGQAQAAVSPAWVPAGTWVVDPARSTAGFAVRDKLVTTVHGTFAIASGTVITGSDGQVVSAVVTLDVAGVSTGNGRRDRDLLKPRFLDAGSHPTIVVEAGSTATRATGWRVEATLSARGASAPLVLEVVPTSVEERAVRVRATGRLDRTGLGLAVPTFVVGRHVEVEVDLVAAR